MGNKKLDWLENMLLVKIPQFLSNQADILTKSLIHEPVTLTKWHDDRVKTVDFLQRDNILASPVFYYPYFTYKKSYICALSL